MSDQDKNLVTYCGLSCGDCLLYNSEIADLSRDLMKRLKEKKFDKNYEKFSKRAKEFRYYPQFYELLGVMTNLRCKGCRNGGDPPSCEIRACAQKKGFEGCWECDEFETCKKLDFLKPRHGDTHLKNLRKIKKLGIEEFLKEKNSDT